MLNNTQIKSTTPLISPDELMAQIPLTDNAEHCIGKYRKIISDIMQGLDDRLMVLVGPCSIHDPESAMEYAERLAILQKELGEDNVILVMRVYFEKPRTTIGWKGMINDPNLDGSNDVQKGLPQARRILVDINDIGVPAGSELLDPISPAYIGDTISYGAIGARTTESQIHREMASGISAPVGFKNGTDGSTKIATDAIQSAREPHSFLGISDEGKAAVQNTNGNKNSHIILRGGSSGPNYDPDSVKRVSKELREAKVDTPIVIDFSHANSVGENGLKEHGNQLKLVCSAVADQIKNGRENIGGVMLESHLVEGNQKISDDLTYGQSITDACIGWGDTEKAIKMLDTSVGLRRDKIKEDGRLTKLAEGIDKAPIR